MAVPCLATAILVMASARALPEEVPNPVTHPKQDSAPLVVAHRGGAGLRPENSLQAFRHALDLGVDAVELDVHLTRDDVPVVMHDATVDRTTDGRGSIRNMTLAEFRRLRVRTPEAEPIDEPPPTLEEVLSVIRGRVGLFLEMKHPRRGSYPGLIRSALDLVRAADMQDRTQVISFDLQDLSEARAAAPDIRTRALASQSGVDRAGGPAAWLDSVLGAGSGAIGLRYDTATPDVLAAVRDRRLALGVWTVNEPDDMRRMLRLGVDSITTDRPDLLLEVLGRGRPSVR